LAFTGTGTGGYRGDWIAARPGVYQFVVRAEGTTSGNARFTRAKILTAGVWAGGDRPFDPPGGGHHGGGRDAESCGVLLCVLEQITKSPKLLERLKELGFDVHGLRHCIEAECKRKGRIMEGKQVTTEAHDTWKTLSRAAEIDRLITTLGAPGLADVKVLEAPKTAPVKRKPRLEGAKGNQFVLEEDANKGKGGKTKR
jgi:hypothetical protein